VLWTPTVLIFDADGAERHRIEGYLPNGEFRAQMELGLARVAFMHKQWADAERRYGEVLQNYPDSATAPEALYWQGVSCYKGTNDHTALGGLAQRFKQKYQDTIWAEKASVWS
jgi:TolA-binding protein